jgi:putative nucleotidyltransferase with HDIG domain
MEPQITGQVRTWFTAYCRSFVGESDEDRANYLLKETHTYAVHENSLAVARDLGLSDREADLAGVIGLLHDVGRFPQYRDYRTFRDSVSKNHAVLGAKVLLEREALAGLPKPDRDVIVHAVTLHNVFALPAGLAGRTLLHSRIIRDADKLDIWRIFIDLLALPEAERPSVAGLGLPETDGYSPEVLPFLEERRMVRLTSLRTLNDFKLLQLAWVYDLNFLPSLRLLRERGIVQRLAATLPRTAEVRRAVDAVLDYVDERLAEGGDPRIPAAPAPSRRPG